MSTLTNSQTETIKKMVERLQAKPNSKNELELNVTLKQLEYVPYYSLASNVQNIIRLCKGAILFMSGNEKSTDVSIYDVLTGLEIAEQMQDIIMQDIDLIDYFAKTQIK